MHYKVLLIFKLHIRLPYWCDTQEVIGWFKELEKSKICKFIQLDIDSYDSTINLVLN